MYINFELNGKLYEVSFIVKTSTAQGWTRLEEEDAQEIISSKAIEAFLHEIRKDV